MKIVYFLTAIRPELESFEFNLDTIKSIETNLGEDDKVVEVIGVSEEMLWESLNQQIKQLNDCTHIVIVRDGDLFFPYYRQHLTDYVNPDLPQVWMTMVQLNFKDKVSGEWTFRGFANTCIWKPELYLALNLPVTTGYLLHELALKQIDLSLEGTLIPLEVAQKYPFDSTIKYYSAFEWYNRISQWETEKESEDVEEQQAKVTIIGIPKVGLQHNVAPIEATDEEKLKFFKKCQEPYLLQKATN